MRRYKFLAPALLEVRGASEFYESNRSELGREFLEELDASMQRVLDNPGAWQVLE